MPSRRYSTAFITHVRETPVDRIFRQIWLAFIVVYLTTGGTFVAGALVGYAWYLFVHYCAHQNPAIGRSRTSSHAAFRPP